MNEPGKFSCVCPKGYQLQGTRLCQGKHPPPLPSQNKTPSSRCFQSHKGCTESILIILWQQVYFCSVPVRWNIMSCFLLQILMNVKQGNISVLTHRPVWISTDDTNVWTRTGAKSPMCRCLKSEWRLMKASVCSYANTHFFIHLFPIPKICASHHLRIELAPVLSMAQTGFPHPPITFSTYNVQTFLLSTLQCNKKTITEWASVGSVTGVGHYEHIPDELAI